MIDHELLTDCRNTLAGGVAGGVMKRQSIRENDDDDDDDDDDDREGCDRRGIKYLSRRARATVVKNGPALGSCQRQPLGLVTTKAGPGFPLVLRMADTDAGSINQHTELFSAPRRHPLK
ncbi:hypothetical protein PAAG_12128 [Paracoccidioides lutzii Pb01]|uniref:Uncharacterized protein n=1 Tax=Paracoccidioides lutzii (strain ATCC MYA-826 / Pb01) TaxID=502779 RepID=A0A0A2V143_PARBA|nr:hypothetical protein PAAG_12128 [Paracoccidioides lutzii Pb01]KGQ01183.1 hypothetical protein PAAG_12128 [Paracoccidioides lutzii Pb01]